MHFYTSKTSNGRGGKQDKNCTAYPSILAGKRENTTVSNALTVSRNIEMICQISEQFCWSNWLLKYAELQLFKQGDSILKPLSAMAILLKLTVKTALCELILAF